MRRFFTVASAALGRSSETRILCVRALKARFNVIRLDVRSFPNERPAHRVRVDGFWIDEHEVTNAEFARFVAVTGYLTTAEKTAGSKKQGDYETAG